MTYPTALDVESSKSILRTAAFDTIALHCIALQRNSATFKAVCHLCICDRCMIDYGACSLFSSHELQIFKKIILRSEVEIKNQNSDDQT